MTPADWTPGERAVLRRLRAPERVQRFLDEELGYNLEEKGETLRSARRVLRDRVAHCIEGALLAAAAFEFHGGRPRLLLMRAVRDDDHVLALFRGTGTHGAWGAVAKSNYSGLRFREPVYRTVRELAMSYFEHYYNRSGQKTLRAISAPVPLERFRGWETSEANLWELNDALAHVPLTPLLTAAQARALRHVDGRLFAAGLLGSHGDAPHRLHRLGPFHLPGAAGGQ